MDFRESDRAREYRERLEAFMDECVYPAEATIGEQVRASGARTRIPGVEIQEVAGLAVRS